MTRLIDICPNVRVLWDAGEEIFVFCDPEMAVYYEMYDRFPATSIYRIMAGIKHLARQRQPIYRNEQGILFYLVQDSDIENGIQQFLSVYPTESLAAEL